MPEGWSVDQLDKLMKEDLPWGLHIVGTERHEARRIDRQLRGRAGRQGDPGSSRFFLSLEDDLMRLFGSDRIATVMDKLGAEEGEVITHSLVTRSIERAQRRVEVNNFEIRKRLLEYDDVMNKQREVIYGMRLRALEGQREDVLEEARETVQDAAEAKVALHIDSAAYADTWDLAGLREDLMRTFLLPFDWLDRMVRSEQEAIPPTSSGAGSEVDELPSTYDEIVARVQSDLDRALDRRVEEWGEEAIHVFQRVLLSVVDEKWRDHLYELDQLKSGIQYRAWGQKDPLIEYKKEAYEMFVEMMDDLHQSAAALLFRVRLLPPGVMTAEERRRRERLQRQQVALHTAPSGAAAFAGAASEAATQALGGRGGVATATAGAATTLRARGSAGGARPDASTAPPPPGSAPETYIREGDKVGRNDPCPCGSGKKYKRCHGS
jgi:preprotein translocase subunit SecA